MAYIKQKSERKFKITVCNGYKVNGALHVGKTVSILFTISISTGSISCRIS